MEILPASAGGFGIGRIRAVAAGGLAVSHISNSGYLAVYRADSGYVAIAVQGGGRAGQGQAFVDCDGGKFCADDGLDVGFAKLGQLAC